MNINETLSRITNNSKHDFSLLDKVIAMTISEEYLEKQVSKNNSFLFGDVISRFCRGNYLLQKKKYTSKIRN